MISRVQARINLKALRANFQIAKTHAGNSKMLAVIKANAYGHGLIPVAEALSEAELYAVTDINEAELLRASGTNKAILILQGIIDKSDIARIAQDNFQVVVHSSEQLQWLDDVLGKSPPAAPITFWMKIDSGMGRLGISPQDTPALYQALLNKPYTEDVIMMTHLANSSLPESELNAQQIAAFAEIQNALIGHRVQTSIPASSGLLALPGTQSDWARPGIMLYGSSPFFWEREELRRESFRLQAVMNLEAKLIAIKEMKAGDNVGYCSQYICPEDMRIGIVSIGYADGYPSTAPNGTPVMVNGVRAKTCGRVSMDMIAIDLQTAPSARVGDLVTLWGDDLSLDEIAAKTGILSYNLTCSISSRVPFHYEEL